MTGVQTCALPIYMTFTKEGFVIEQNDQRQEVSWDQIGRVEHMQGQLIIYMSRIRAYLLPDRIVGEDREGLWNLMREAVPKERRKGI